MNKRLFYKSSQISEADAKQPNSAPFKKCNPHVVKMTDKTSHIQKN